MNTVALCVVTLLGLALYIFGCMLLYRWFVETVLDWVRDQRITARHGIIALYRLSKADPLGEQGLAGAVGPLSPALVPLALLELGLRLLLRRLRPTTPTTFLA